MEALEQDHSDLETQMKKAEKYELMYLDVLDREAKMH